MGLIDLKTNLRSLSYGTGRGEPYIKRPLPAYDEDPGNPFLGLNMFGRAGQLGRNLTDVERLTKYLTNGKGLLFNAKQIALEKTRPKTPYGPKRSFLFSTVLAQAGVQGTGIHFDRANSLNVDNDQKYDYLTRTAFSEENTNRLTLLYNSKIVKTTTNPKARKEFGITGEGDETTIISYAGGPNSIGGLGKTTFTRSDRNNTSNWDKRPELKNKVLALTPNNLNEFYKGRSNTTGFTSFSDGGGITNFTLALNGLSNADSNTKKRILGRITRYDQFNRAKTFKTGDQGKDKLLDRQSYYTGAPQPTAGTDIINFKKVYSSTNGVNFDKSSEDMIKFYIAVLDNDNPEKKTYIHFRAYVEGIQDNYTANWSSINYSGRGEEFYKYGGFNRDIGFSFKVHVSSRAELFPTYQKLNYLASVMAPDYSSPGYMRGNIVELTLGDYFNDVPGVITNFSYNLSDETSWDIARNNDGTIDENSAELATLISVDSFTFKPIHKFLPEKAINPSNPQSKFISLGSNAKGYTPTPAPTSLNPINPTPPTPTLQLPS
jgi:hypothetical protein